MTFTYYLWLCLKKPSGKFNGKLPAPLFYIEYLVIVSPFIQFLAHAYITQNTLFMRSEWSRLQAEVLKLPLLVLAEDSLFHHWLSGSGEWQHIRRDSNISSSKSRSLLCILYCCHYYISKAPFSHGHFITLLELPSPLTPSLTAKKGIKLFSWSYHLPENNKGPFVCL